MTRLPFEEWRDMECPVEGHFHVGPSDACLATMDRLAALGDGSHLCHNITCKSPVARRSVCARCGRDHAPIPEKPAVLFGGGERVGKWQSDGLGCVERTSFAERLWMNGGYE